MLCGSIPPRPNKETIMKTEKPTPPKTVLIKESNPTNKPWWKFW